MDKDRHNRSQMLRWTSLQLSNSLWFALVSKVCSSRSAGRHICGDGMAWVPLVRDLSDPFLVHGMLGCYVLG